MPLKYELATSYLLHIDSICMAFRYVEMDKSIFLCNWFYTEFRLFKQYAFIYKFDPIILETIEYVWITQISNNSEVLFFLFTAIRQSTLENLFLLTLFMENSYQFSYSRVHLKLGIVRSRYLNYPNTEKMDLFGSVGKSFYNNIIAIFVSLKYYEVYIVIDSVP